MGELEKLARERTELTADQVEHLQALAAQWTLLADLSFSDLLLWVPTWNEGGYIAVAQVRPSTGPTVHPEDIVGTFLPRGRMRQLDLAMRTMRIVSNRQPDEPLTPVGTEAIPVVHERTPVAVIARRSALSLREAGGLETVYREVADSLAEMITEGTFPVHGLEDSASPPRVGDGLLKLDVNGVVDFASPNARSALRRLGIAIDVQGHLLEAEMRRLLQRSGPLDETIGVVSSGRVPGTVDVEHGDVAVSFRSLPLLSAGVRTGAAVLVRDVTDLRLGERALLTKDTTIREIHHRVKNNLQTVAALLRMQGRRLDDSAARAALEESVRRVSAIAIVHETLSHSDSDAVDFDQVSDRLLGVVSELAVGVSLSRRGSVGELPGSIASSLSLVVSELLQNAVEHGFPEDSVGGNVVLTMHRRGSRITVAVVDDGVGLPHGFDPAVDARLGLQIVRTLVHDELKGSLSWEPGLSGRGTSAELDLVLPRSAALD